MPNPTVYSLYLAQAAAAITEARVYSALSHAGTKGRLRELVVGKLLRPLLPATWGVGTGLVVDASGTEDASPQEDIIIYDRQLIPPLLVSGEQMIVPVEACLAVVEVKSCLTATELDSAIRHAGHLARLEPDFRLLPGRRIRAAAADPERAERLYTYIRRPTYALFAFDSDLRAATNVEALDAEWSRLCLRHEKAGHSASIIDILCCVQRGTVLSDYAAPAFKKYGRHDSDPRLGEVVAFVSLLFDLLRAIGPQRHAWFYPPKIHSYLERPPVGLNDPSTELLNSIPTFDPPQSAMPKTHKVND